MTAKEKLIPVQETFLNALMKTKKNVEINLINGNLNRIHRKTTAVLELMY